MKRIVHLGLVGVVLATMVVAVLPVFEPQPVMAMTGSGTEADPYMVYNITDLQAINDLIGGTRYSRPWDDNFGLAEQSGTWTTYPIEGYETELFWNKVDEVTSDTDTTYIQAESDNAICLLAYEGTPLSLPEYATNIVVKIHARVRNTAAGTSYVQGMVRDVTTDYLIGSNTTISSQSYALKTWTMNNPPWRSWDEWTVADAYLAGFGVGVKVSDATPNLRITQLYIEVSYLAAPYIKLANDIDASDTVTWNGGAGFVPLGTFGGTFDGQGYTISNLSINRTSSYQALFASVDGATLQNINLNVSLIGVSRLAALVVWAYGGSVISNCHSSGTIEASGFGAGEVGGLICQIFDASVSNSSSACVITNTGSNSGGFAWTVEDSDALVEDCYATGDVAATSFAAGFAVFIRDASIVRRCYATGDVETTDDYAGGFACEIYEDSTVEQCYATGHVEAGDSFDTSSAGGFSATILDNAIARNCYARGNVTATGDLVGGFAAYTYTLAGTLLVQNCFSTGAVAGVGTDIGGFLGADWGGTISDCFWDTQTSGQATSDGGTGKATAEMKTIGTFSAWDIALTEVAALNDGYPFLSWQIGNSPTWLINPMFGDFNQVVHFQPNTIILSTTLPNRAGGGGVYPNGTFSWGGNPAGIDIRLDGFLQPEDVYRFEPIMPGGWDIIEPEPVGMTGDVDLGKLAKNPFRPMVQVIASGAGFTERLAWLLLAIFILIAIMIAVLLWTQHMVFTALAGFAVGFMFYSMGVWGLWVVILLAFGLVASIVYERMPTL